MKSFLIAGLLLAASFNVSAQKAEGTYVKVYDVVPKYVQVSCPVQTCGSTPDLRQVGSYLYYECDGEKYRNWIPGKIQIGMYVQVINCTEMVVDSNRTPVQRHADGF